jgi:serine/threonine protein kinase
MNGIQVEHPASQRLEAFALGQLSDGELVEIEAHLASCSACRQATESVADDTLVALLRSAATDPESSAGPTTQNAAGRAGPVTTDDGIPEALATHPRYRVQELLGVGGMGAVYRAEHLLMQRSVALKVINRELIDRPATSERFEREVRAAARLVHPNIVTAFDAEQAGDLHFLVMEYVEGTSLARRVADTGPLPVAEACEYVRQAALGLQHAHERGMVHRDIKPHNLMITSGGQVKILDFGLARFVMETAPAGNLLAAPVAASAESGRTPESITQIGTVMGTPDYIAPEQARDAHTADIRADIYSLGCTLYHLLAGQVPYPEGTAQDKIDAHQERMPKPLTELRADLPPKLVRVVERLTARDPEKRYQAPAEVAAALAPFSAPAAASRPMYTRPGQWCRRHRSGIAAGLLGVLALAAAVILIIKTSRGQITIQTDDPSIELVARRNGDLVLIRDLKGGKTWDLDTKNLNIGQADSPDGLRVSLDGQSPVLLKHRDGKVVVTIDGPAGNAGQIADQHQPAGGPQNARLAALREIVARKERLYKNAAVPLTQVVQAKLDLYQAELDLAGSQPERVEILQNKIVPLRKELEEYYQKLFSTGAISDEVFLKARADRLKAESDLQRTAQSNIIPNRRRANERLDTLQKIVALKEGLFKLGRVTAGDVIEAKLELARAELDLSESDEEWVAVLQKIVGLAKDLEDYDQKLFQAARTTEETVLKARADRLKAESDLEQARSKGRSAAQQMSTPRQRTEVTVLYYELEDKKLADNYRTREILAALLQLIDPTRSRNIGVQKRAADKRFEIYIRGGSDHAANVAAVKEALAHSGFLEFGILANDVDDKEAVEAARSYFAEIRRDAGRKRELAERAKRGLPPPPLRPPEGVGFKTDLGEFTYRWVELGPAEREALQVARPADKAGASSRWEKAAAARALGEPVVLDDYGRALLFSRACQNQGISEQERANKRVDYFLLVRDPQKDPKTGQSQAVTGHDLESVQAVERAGKRTAVALHFNKRGGNLLEHLTARNAPIGPPSSPFHRYLAMILDGQIVVASAINATVSTDVLIEGNFTDREADRLVQVLRAAALPARLKPEPVAEQHFQPNQKEN